MAQDNGPSIDQIPEQVLGALVKDAELRNAVLQDPGGAGAAIKGAGLYISNEGIEQLRGVIEHHRANDGDLMPGGATTYAS